MPWWRGRRIAVRLVIEETLDSPNLGFTPMAATHEGVPEIPTSQESALLTSSSNEEHIGFLGYRPYWQKALFVHVPGDERLQIRRLEQALQQRAELAEGTRGHGGAMLAKRQAEVQTARGHDPGVKCEDM